MIFESQAGTDGEHSGLRLPWTVAAGLGGMIHSGL